jgi:signal transduction histidine kinase
MPAAEVDLGELVAELIRNSVPATMQLVPGSTPPPPHHRTLRFARSHAFSNLIRNAVEAGRETGSLDVTVGIEQEREGGIAGVRVTVADRGPGVVKASNLTLNPLGKQFHTADLLRLRAGRASVR